MRRTRNACTCNAICCDTIVYGNAATLRRQKGVSMVDGCKSLAMAGEEFDCRRSVVGPPTLSAAATALIALSTAAMGGLQNFAQPPREPIPGRVRKSSAKVDMVLSEEKKNGGWPRMESEDGMATFGSGQAMERVHLADCGVTGMHTSEVTMVSAGRSKAKARAGARARARRRRCG